jgi:hypothetical protein
MIDFGTQSTSGRGQQTLGTQNIAVPLLQNLFGQRTRTDPRAGGFLPGGSGSRFQFADPVFGPQSFSALGGLTEPINVGGLQDGGIESLINRTAGQQEELAETGFRTAIDPAIDLSSQIFREEFIPGALEQFGVRGLDPRDADVQSALLREGSRRATELGALDLQLEEAAKNRRLLGMQGAGDLLNLQNLGQATAFGQSEAGQLLNNLLALSGGIGGPSGVTGTTKSEGSGFNFGILGGLGGG